MGTLKDATIYTSGPIESSNDCVSWREAVTPYLLDFGMVVWNPLKKPTWVPNVDGITQRQMRKMFSFDDIVKEKNSAIRKYGLHCAANCDIILLRVTGEHTVGTYEELSVARFKPVLCWCDEKIPSMWLVDQLGAYDCVDFVFHITMESLLKTLSWINDGNDLPDNYKWMFLTHGR